MASTDAKPVPQKNVAFRATFPIYDTSGARISGATALDSQVDLDKAGFGACTNEATETGSSGIYTLDLTAAEMNADTVTITVATSSADAVYPVLVLYPEETGDIRSNVTQMATDVLTAAALAADAVAEIQNGLPSIGTGANSVTLTIQDDNSDPVQGISVTIKNSGQTAVIAGPGTTNSSGQVIFNLDDGSYKAIVSTTTIYETLAAQTLTVSGTTTATYTITRHVIPSPSDPTLCRVYGYILDPRGETISGTQVIFQLEDPTSTEVSTNLVSIDTLIVRTNGDGYFYADLIRSSQFTPSVDYKVSCEKVGLRTTITVPDSATASLNSL